MAAATSSSPAAFQAKLESLSLEYCHLYQRCQHLEKENEAMRFQISSWDDALATWEPSGGSVGRIAQGTASISHTDSTTDDGVVLSAVQDQAAHSPTSLAPIYVGDRSHVMPADVSTPNLPAPSASLVSLHHSEAKVSSASSEVLPKFLQLWTAWLDETVEERQSSPSAVCGRRTNGMYESRPSKEIIRAGDAVTDKSCLQQLVLRPSSRIRVGWDLLSVFAIAYDVTTVPLQAFPMKETMEMTVLDCFMTSFWTFDILLSFLLGFYQSGVLEMRPKLIAKKYLKSSFFFDVFIVLVDWLTMILSDRIADITGVLRMGKSLRLTRVLRSLRLLRVMKLGPLLGQYSDYIRSDNVITMLSIGKLLLAIVFVNHFIACGWYAIGSLDLGEGTPTWVAKLELSETQEGNTPTTFWECEYDPE